MHKIFLGIVLCAVLVGCAPKKGMVEFVNVVHDHRVLTNETTDALISSIQDELDTGKAVGAMTPENEQVLLSLIERLEYMSRQGKVIEDYVSAKHIDNELLARLLKSKWKGK